MKPSWEGAERKSGPEMGLEGKREEPCKHCWGLEWVKEKHWETDGELASHGVLAGVEKAGKQPGCSGVIYDGRRGAVSQPRLFIGLSTPLCLLYFGCPPPDLVRYNIITYNILYANATLICALPLWPPPTPKFF